MRHYFQLCNKRDMLHDYNFTGDKPESVSISRYIEVEITSVSIMYIPFGNIIKK